MEATELVKRRQKHYSAEERARLIGEYRASGLSVEEYAQGAGMSDWTVRRWLKEAKRQQRATGRTSRAPRLVPVVIGPDLGETDRIEVILVEGARLRVPVTIGAGQLEALISAVRRAC
jgi:transposase-like protein